MMQIKIIISNHQQSWEQQQKIWIQKCPLAKKSVASPREIRKTTKGHTRSLRKMSIDNRVCDEKTFLEKKKHFFLMNFLLKTSLRHFYYKKLRQSHKSLRENLEHDKSANCTRHWVFNGKKIFISFLMAMKRRKQRTKKAAGILMRFGCCRR